MRAITLSFFIPGILKVTANVPVLQVSRSSVHQMDRECFRHSARQLFRKMAAIEAEAPAAPQQTYIISSAVTFIESLFSWI